MNKLLSLILITFAMPCFGESYLCIGEKSTGYKGEKDFKITNFIENKWIIKSTEDDIFAKEGEKWALSKHGEHSIPKYCKYIPEDYVLNETFGDRPIICGDGKLSTFMMSIKTLKFIYFYSGAYVYGTNLQDDIIVEIGTCSKI